MLCMALTACAPKAGENTQPTSESTEVTAPLESGTPADPEETTVPADSGETTVPTDSGETTVPTDSEETTVPTDPEEETTVPADPEETTVPTDPEETTAPVETTQPTTSDSSDSNGEIKLGCYDNDTGKLSLAFMEDGTVYLMEDGGYWKGEYLTEGSQVELVFQYKTERGTVNAQGELTLEGRDGSFIAVGDSNGWGPKLSTILSEGDSDGDSDALIGSWYNETTGATLVFNTDGTVYQVLSAAIMEGSCQKSGDGFVLSFSLGGKVFGPYAAKLSGEGQLVLEGQDGVYVKQS